MHRYEELEQLYYKKKYKQIAIITFIVIIVSFIIGFLFFKFKDNKTTQKPVVEHSVKGNNTLSLNPIAPKIPIKDLSQKPKTEPKEIKKVEHKKEVKKEVKHTKKVVKQTPKKEIKKESQKPQIKIIKKEVKPKPQIVIEEEKPLVIKKRVVNLSDLIDLFNQNHNYNIAIKIANIYFDREDYAESIRWSKKANQINPDDYQSWLIFAKSLIKVRQIQKAIEVLQTYIDTYGPEEHIQSLLRSIE